MTKRSHKNERRIMRGRKEITDGRNMRKKTQLADDTIREQGNEGRMKGRHKNLRNREDNEIGNE